MITGDKALSPNNVEDFKLLTNSDNKNVIEQAAVIKGLNQDNINDPKIGKGIAKYLKMRLNAISDFLILLCNF